MCAARQVALSLSVVVSPALSLHTTLPPVTTGAWTRAGNMAEAVSGLLARAEV
jgi:hypothetical protein